MEKSKSHILRFRDVNRDIFAAINDGRKKTETRAGSPKYRGIKAGDRLVLVCGKDRMEKVVKKVEKYAGIADLLKKHKPQEINPASKTAGELEEIYYSFPGYREKIKRYGLVVFEL
ncbi:MAG: hypothetical protein PHQ47_02705 [Candidatus Portnoybacteria bacterium]|nr:hypothetical protein [Candidatus Portnoybacteria bacterium]